MEKHGGLFHGQVVSLYLECWVKGDRRITTGEVSTGGQERVVTAIHSCIQTKGENTLCYETNIFHNISEKTLAERRFPG